MSHRAGPPREKRAALITADPPGSAFQPPWEPDLAEQQGLFTLLLDIYYSVRDISQWSAVVRSVVCVIYLILDITFNKLFLLI